MTSFKEPERLASHHDIDGFRCGRAVMDQWLVKYARGNQTGNMTRVFVTTVADTDEVAGFYALSTGGVDHATAPARVIKGVARHPIPVIILTRLAIHEDYQGKGLGRGLLRDALIRVANASEQVGVRALLIHAKDEEARDFYLRQVREFEPSPADPLQLFLLLKDLRMALSRGTGTST